MKNDEAQGTRKGLETSIFVSLWVGTQGMRSIFFPLFYIYTYINKNFFLGYFLKKNITTYLWQVEG